MKYSLLNNGIDSLKSAFINLDKVISKEYEPHHVKDSIMFLAHGTEILLKYLLSEKDYKTIFVDEERNMKKYKAAEEKRIKLGLDNVFLVDSSLRTINANKALHFLTDFYELDCTYSFPELIKYLSYKRNEIMHSAIELNEEQTLDLISKLTHIYSQIIFYFHQHIPNFSQLIENARFDREAFETQKYKQKLDDEAATVFFENQQEMYYESLAEQADTLEDYYNH